MNLIATSLSVSQSKAHSICPWAPLSILEIILNLYSNFNTNLLILLNIRSYVGDFIPIQEAQTFWVPIQEFSLVWR